jgi:hypothetical protein
MSEVCPKLKIPWIRETHQSYEELPPAYLTRRPLAISVKSIYSGSLRKVKI